MSSFSQQIISFFIQEGVTKIRFTGGEPTIYPHLTELVAFTRATAERNDVPLSIHLTTNGLTLGGRSATKLQELASAGLNGVNISLDSLIPSRFEALTRRKGHDHVLRCLEHSLQIGLQTKLNCVVMRGRNDDELVNFVDLTRDKPIDVRFIEFMPFDHNDWRQDTVVSFNEMRARIEMERPEFVAVEGDEHRIARMFHVQGYRGRVGFISSITQAFCDSCTRVRVTADGKLKACLLDSSEVDLKPVLRSLPPEATPPNVMNTINNASECENDALRSLVRQALSKKKLRHADAEEMKMQINRPMVAIGG